MLHELVSMDTRYMPAPRSVRKLVRSSYVRLAVLTSLAALFAYLAADALPFADPVPAAITAVVATRVTFHHAVKESFFQVLGALLGGAVALVIVYLVGSGPLLIFLLVLLSFAIARLLHITTPSESPFFAMSLSVTVILVVGAHFTNEGALERFLGVAVGGVFALIASFLATPTKDTRLIDEGLTRVQRQLSELLTRIAHDLRSHPSELITRGWYDEAVELRNEVLGLAAQLEDLKIHHKWNPRIDPDEVERLRSSLDANQVMSARVLSITSDLRFSGMAAKDSAIPDEAISPLADLIALAADNMAADDPTESIGRTAAHEAVRVADHTAQIALIGGIVSHINRINQASTYEDGAEEGRS
jgi:uncharacterized membrane protein YccC